MTTIETPEILTRFVDAVNRGDTEGFLACFTEDGVVNDWGRPFHGHDGIRRWSDGEFIGAKGKLTVQSTALHGNTVVMKANWASRVFTGDSVFTFTLSGGRIREMKITE
ncbi:nuclear transport factor 2 family protein [Szabonella alba]|uniref:Nuclear transport factor 2 family protein n=1 Tax=Szabonella alba TaxID=2804194 RepID=A0A8K0VFT5_9RHOB|nr:nuclear transport factor 2 family protein [Szabonella alba]MBL4918552.1 nuclear transport factor 2 family protein [Szabonella alba]